MGYLPSYWVRLRALNSAAVATYLWEAIGQKLGQIESTPRRFDSTLLTFCIWAADIGAYTIGKFFGRTRL